MLRLKISPREALIKIDKQLSRGAKILQDFIPAEIEDWCMYDFSEHSFEEEDTGSSSESENIEAMDSNIVDWSIQTSKILETVFLDFTPQYAFKSARVDFSLKSRPKDRKAFLVLAEYLKAKLDVLEGFYNHLITYFRLPYLYLPDQGVLCFYDMTCLIVGKNERALCSFMFDKDIGTLQQFMDIYGQMEGEVTDDKRDRQIKNAVEGVNNKTKERFGFNVFTIKDKKGLFINVSKGVLVSDI